MSGFDSTATAASESVAEEENLVPLVLMLDMDGMIFERRFIKAYEQLLTNLARTARNEVHQALSAQKEALVELPEALMRTKTSEIIQETEQRLMAQYKVEFKAMLKALISLDDTNPQIAQTALFTIKNFLADNSNKYIVAVSASNRQDLYVEGSNIYKAGGSYTPFSAYLLSCLTEVLIENPELKDRNISLRRYLGNVAEQPDAPDFFGKSAALEIEKTKAIISGTYSAFKEGKFSAAELSSFCEQPVEKIELESIYSMGVMKSLAASISGKIAEERHRFPYSRFTKIHIYLKHLHEICRLHKGSADSPIQAIVMDDEDPFLKDAIKVFEQHPELLPTGVYITCLHLRPAHNDTSGDFTFDLIAPPINPDEATIEGRGPCLEPEELTAILSNIRDMSTGDEVAAVFLKAMAPKLAAGTTLKPQ